MPAYNLVDYGLSDERTPPDFRCIECGNAPRLTDGSEIYPHRTDLHAKRFYICDQCAGSYCGCHPNTTTPLGYPCGAQTRKARSAAHDAIDPIWRSGNLSRHAVYRKLADLMKIPREQCHVAWMSAADAAKVKILAEQIQ